MSAEETPGAVAAHGAYVSDHRGRQVIGENNRQQTFARAPIRVTLIGFDRREAAGISVRGYAAVLDLCRELVAAGFDPACPLEAWRGQILCLRVRSIGQGARLTVADDRPGPPSTLAGTLAKVCRGLAGSANWRRRYRSTYIRDHQRERAIMVNPKLTRANFKTGRLVKLFSQREPDALRELQILCAAIAASGAHLIFGGRTVRR